MAEWLKAHAWKACLGETLTRARIPVSPPPTINRLRCCLWFCSSGYARRSIGCKHTGLVVGLLVPIQPNELLETRCVSVSNDERMYHDFTFDFCNPIPDIMNVCDKE